MMRCNICNAICNDSKDTVYCDVSKKFTTTCNKCSNNIKEVNVDFNMIDTLGTFEDTTYDWVEDMETEDG
jgi:hypothetical protein